MHFQNESTRNICYLSSGNAYGMGSHSKLNKVPDFLHQLLTTDVEFRCLIQAYNGSLQIATCEADSKYGSGMYVNQETYLFYICIHGMLYHGLPPVPREGHARPRFCQLYMIDNALEKLVDTSKDYGIDIKTLLEKTYSALTKL